MASQDCINAIRAAAPNISDEAMSDIVESLERVRRNRVRKGQTDGLADVLREKAAELVTREQRAAKLLKANRIKDKIRRERNLAFIRSQDDAHNALNAILGGSREDIADGRYGVATLHEALRNKWVGQMFKELEQEDLLKYISSRWFYKSMQGRPRLDSLVYDELYDISLKEPKGSSSNPVSGSKVARRIAEIINKYQRKSMDKLNREGAMIDPTVGFIHRQGHDADQLLRHGMEQWKEDIRPLIDMDRLPDGVDEDNLDEFLESFWKATSSGVHKVSPEKARELPVFQQPGNLAKKVSQPRVIHFKDGASRFQYDQKYNPGNLLSSVLLQLDIDAKNAALMEKLGTNPTDAFKRLRDAAIRENRENPNVLGRLQDESLDVLFDVVTGEDRKSIAPSRTRNFAVVRASMAMAFLGKSVLSAFTDLGFVIATSTRRGHGRNMLEVYRDAIVGPLRNAPARQRLEMSASLGVGLDSMLGNVASRMAPHENIPGRYQDVYRFFFRANFLGWWTDANKAGLGDAMSVAIGRQSRNSWADMDGSVKELLSSVGVGEKTWEALRTKQMPTRHGYPMFVPDMAEQLTDAEVRGIIGKDAKPGRINAFRDDLSTRLRVMYIEMTESAVPTPGARDRAMITRSSGKALQKGSWLREVWDLMTQFKQFPVTVLSRTGRELTPNIRRGYRAARRGGRGRLGAIGAGVTQGNSDLKHLAHMMAVTSALGTGVLCLKSMTAGKDCSPLDDHMTFIRGALQGGGVGIYGDFLLAESNKYGRGLTSTFAGPAVGTLGDLDRARAELIEGDFRGAAKQAFLTATNVTPFSNLFYLDKAMKILILYDIEEAIDPGSLARKERRARREEQPYFIRPTSDRVSILTQ